MHRAQVLGLFLPETLNKPMWETLAEALAAEKGTIAMVEMDVCEPPHCDSGHCDPRMYDAGTGE